MPALPSVTKVFRLDFQFSRGGNTNIFNRLFYQYTTAISAADAVTLVNKAANNWGSSLLTLQSGDTILTSVKLTDLNSNVGQQATVATNAAGTATGASQGNGVAVVIGQEILRRYRGSKGRIYITGVPQTALANAELLLAAVAANYTTQMTSFNSSFVLAPPAGVGAMTPVQVSYFQGFTNVTSLSGRTRPRPTLRVTPLIDAIIGYDTALHLASQRRRNQSSA